MINYDKISQFVDEKWDQEIIPVLCDYIRIPNKSVAFDPHWEEHGYMQKATDLLEDWAKKQTIKGMHVSQEKIPGRSPLIFIEIPGQIEDTILLYGHLDKQPEMSGWREDLGPWKPVLEDNKLYGRGGADDGYAIFATLTAIAALQSQNIPHARCVIIIEASEESGNPDLPPYLDLLASRIGEVNFVVCLDSGAGNYQQLWNTTSLRGLIRGTLTVSLLKEGIHSGFAGGAVASSFRVARNLLDRIENSETGEILIKELHQTIPQQRLLQSQQTADVLEDEIIDFFPLQNHVLTVDSDPCTLLLNTAWRPCLSIIGVDGIPSVANASSTLRPFTTLKLSLRLPPGINAHEAGLLLKSTLEANPPYQAKVNFEIQEMANGWEAPPLAKWLEQACDEASSCYFDRQSMFLGEGGSIPFMSMLGTQFPKAQFLITGVLGPKSNAHGPNEFLHIPYAKKLTACVSNVLHSHFQHFA